MKVVVLILIALGINFSSFGQTQGFQVSGTVVDSVSQASLDYISVYLKTDKKQPLKSTLTKNGSFSFSAIKPGNYLVSLASIGYVPRTIAITVGNGAKDLGILKMKVSQQTLKEVSVTADKPLMKQEID